MFIYGKGVKNMVKHHNKKRDMVDLIKFICFDMFCGNETIKATVATVTFPFGKGHGDNDCRCRRLGK